MSVSRGGPQARPPALLSLARSAGVPCRIRRGVPRERLDSMPTVTTRSAATGSWPTKSTPRGSAWRTGPCGGSAGTTAGGACSASDGAGTRRPTRRCTMTSSSVTPLRPDRTVCGSRTLPTSRSRSEVVSRCAPVLIAHDRLTDVGMRRLLLSSSFRYRGPRETCRVGVPRRNHVTHDDALRRDSSPWHPKIGLVGSRRRAFLLVASAVGPALQRVRVVET